MKDGRWSAVATIRQASPAGERTLDLPIPHARFATEAEVEAFEVSRAREWIDRNAPPSNPA